MTKQDAIEATITAMEIAQQTGDAEAAMAEALGDYGQWTPTQIEALALLWAWTGVDSASVAAFQDLLVEPTVDRARTAASGGGMATGDVADEIVDELRAAFGW